jgi:hypothetical protein
LCGEIYWWFQWWDWILGRTFLLTTKLEFVMGYKRMKKRKRGKVIKEYIRAISLLGKKEIVDSGIRLSEAMKWFESPNAEGYLDM